VLTRFLKAKPDGFLDEQAFKAFRASEEEFETIGHGDSEPLLSGPATHCRPGFQSGAFLEERPRGTKVCHSTLAARVK
jgi:hypothetical protein